LQGDFDPDLMGDPVREIFPFRDCQTPADARAILREQVEFEVTAMLDLVSDADAFDVVELMRMREFSVTPDPRLSPSGGASLPVEIVGALLLTRPSRKPDPKPREDTRPHEVIAELHERCMRLARIASYRQLTEGQLSDQPLARLASEYQGAVMNIRNLQYDHIRDDHESRLFDAPVSAGLMQKHLGYSYTQVRMARRAMNEISADRMTRLRDETADLMIAHGDVESEEVPVEVMRQFMAGMVEFMFLPANRSVITPTDVATASGLDIDTARKVMNSFAQVFDHSVKPGDRVFDLLMGNNPFMMRPLMSDGLDNFALTSNDIGLDVLRRIFERALTTDPRDVNRYDQKARQPVSEGLAKAYMEKILGAHARGFGYHYRAPKAGVKAGELGSGCETLAQLSDDVEGDILFVIDDVAVVVEVKGKSIADQARRGDVRRLTNDLKVTIGDGARQATRVRDLVEANGGYWADLTTWVDLSAIREVRTVVAVLDDIGPLGTNLADLQQAGILPTERPPIVLSLHDLAVIAEVGERPSEFLLYLRRRTDSRVISHYRALDELDLYMMFLDADLYVPEDPDKVRADHPTAPPATRDERRRFESSDVGTMVGDNGEELTLWMQRDKLPEDQQPAKPTISAPAELLQLIDQMRSDGHSGWLRLGADLLALAGETQQRLLGTIHTSARSTRTDGRYHNAMTAYAGLWGHPTVFVATHPVTLPGEHAIQLLRQYARVKQYQLQSDRAYGLLFTDRGVLEDSFYLSSVPDHDSELDAQIAELKLFPVATRPPTVPPSARRPTKRLNKGKRRH
jgi:hypothetical protein